MNKLLYLILIPLLLLTGCSKDEDNSPESGGESLTFSISPTSHQARSESGSFIINVKANQYWSVITNDGDCSVSPSSGNGNGKVTVKYSNLAEGGSIASFSATRLLEALIGRQYVTYIGNAQTTHELTNHLLRSAMILTFNLQHTRRRQLWKNKR